MAAAPRRAAARRTPAPGLCLASSFAGAGGFSGAMAAGAQAARAAMREKRG